MNVESDVMIQEARFGGGGGGDDPARLGFVSENPVALRNFFLWRGTEIK